MGTDTACLFMVVHSAVEVCLGDAVAMSRCWACDDSEVNGARRAFELIPCDAAFIVGQGLGYG